MRIKNNENIFLATNAQHTLSFLVDHPNEDLLAAEIQNATKVSKAGTYRALDVLIKKRLVKRLKKGRFAFYRINEDDCVVRQFKVLKTVLILKPLIVKLQALSRKVVLFGSVSKGEDYLDSDIDLFIIAKEQQQVKDVVVRFKSKRKLQCVIKAMNEVPDIEKKDPVFLSEVNSGIVLWEEKDVD